MSLTPPRSPHQCAVNLVGRGDIRDWKVYCWDCFGTLDYFREEYDARGRAARHEQSGGVEAVIPMTRRL